MDTPQSIARGSVLLRAPSVQVGIDSSNEVLITVDGHSFASGPHTLAILDAFSQPTTLEDALARLKSRASGVQDWIDVTTTMMRLYRNGVVVDTKSQRPQFGRSGYAGSDNHVRMLDDRQRTASYLAGIREVVKPGDVVLDIGTGTGVLAAAAAAAGARHVYAIEASSVGEVAEALFARNGLADRVTLLRGWSTSITLPERADVLVSELIGDDPLQERVLEVTADALKRLLKPRARLVPSRVRVCGLPVAVPASRMSSTLITPATTRKWSNWYGIDFSSLAAVSRPSSVVTSIRPQQARRWKTFSESLTLAEIDLATNRSPVVETEVQFTASAPGQLSGLLICFEVQLGPTTVLSTNPAVAGRDNHWRSPVIILADPIRLQGGERFVVSYRYKTDNPGISIERA